MTHDRPAPGLRPGFLREKDIRLHTTTRDDEAWDWLGRRRPALIIHDLETGEPTAIALCRRIKASPRTSSIPLIVVAEETTGAQALQAGADVVVSKPIVQREYFEAVRRYVRLPQRRALRHLVNLRFTYSANGESGQAFSRDLSLYGAFLKTDRLLEPGSHLEVQFNIPGEAEAMRCDAVVRRQTPSSPHTHHVGGFGIEFVGIDEGDLARLERFITRHLRRSLFSFIGG